MSGYDKLPPYGEGPGWKRTDTELLLFVLLILGGGMLLVWLFG